MAKAGRLRIPVKLEAAGDTHIGGRTHNEDAILLRPDLNLFLVADGAGGQNAGNVAASLAITTIAHFFEQTQGGADKLPEIDALGLYTAARRLAASVQDANKEIMEIAKSSDKHRGMGTTIVAALFDLDHRCLHVAYVGDSRCYRLRDGRLEQLTHDHSLINDVLELQPNISDERVKKLPQNVITRALGMMDKLRVSVRSHEICHGDRYLLCSDGLSDNVDDGQILESLALEIDCDEQVALLTSMALEAGASDNVATLIVDCSLPQAGQRNKASTRPIKKKSRPALPRIDVLKHRVTEESVPEIVLYDRPESRDSSPLIHVVPAASQPPDVMRALAGVMSEDEQVTKEYLAPMSPELADPTGGEPPARKPLTFPVAVEEVTTKVMETDHAKLREVATQRSDPTADDIKDELTTDSPTKIVSRSPSRAKSKTKSKGGVLTSARKLKPQEKPQATLKPAAMAPATAVASRISSSHVSTSSDGTERGGAAAGPVVKRKGENQISAPRLNKPADAAELEAPRTGDTKAPPGGSDAPPAAESTPPPPGATDAAKRTPAAGSAIASPRREGPFGAARRPPPLPDSRRPTLTGPKPGPSPDDHPDSDGLPLPPAREPFDTSDFTNDSVPCHACGSIIMRTADLCMYCGAPTGFLIDKKK